MSVTINHQTNAISATAGNLTVVASGLSGGGAGQIPYNTAATTTAFLAAGTAGQVLQSNGTSAPSWVAAPGAQDSLFYENNQTVSANYTITSGKNAMTAGDITIASGITVTVPTGQTWTVV